MTPPPQEKAGPAPDSSEVSPDAVVISGISGNLPDCDNYVDFADKIFQNQNLVKASPRWKNFKYPELPEQYGRISGLEHFDAQFFTVFHNLAHAMDPTARKIIEHTYQAIFDAGVSPIELWGKNIGVFVAYGYCETEKITYTTSTHLGIQGCCKSMTANRISYWLNLKGPSFFMDGSSCGTILALEKASDAIIKGDCEAAIVGVGKILLHPETPISHRLMPLNVDGITKCYDDAADGPSMSEAANVFFLQKHKDAKRAYVVLRQVKAGFMAGKEHIMAEQCEIVQNKEIVTKFFRQFYEEAGVSPADIEYIEGYGAACPKIDKMELQAMENVFCKNRDNPLFVGSVSSNVGYTESSSSACAIFKLISAYQRGEVAATINCKKPRNDIASLHDGRMKIVTENMKFNRKAFTAVNGFTYTGLNGHVLLQSCYKPKVLSKYKANIPYLVTVSGRHEAAAQKILNDIKDRPLDPEEIALIHSIHKNRIPKHLARGVGIYSTQDNSTVTHDLKVDYYDGISRPLWFVYSGMGSQWIGMGRGLMQIPIFNKAIQRCHQVLKPKGIDLIHIITDTDKSIFNNILNSFIGITAVQIGLTDILTAVGLVPNNIIGHSLGELACAYADGCFTLEETLLLAYNRGVVSVQTPLIHGSMAAVGMGYKKLSEICPTEIEVVCHNSANSSTISGPEKSVKDFMEELIKRDVFAKEVPCSNIAYHSRYIAEAGPEFLKLSQQVVTHPKLRSSKWLSTSVPQAQWNEPHALYSSAEYHTNNLLNKVLFEEVLQHVPSNAVLIEIAPHGLLQTILKHALSVDCKHISLTRRGEEDGALFLLKSLGNLYMEGYDIDISAMYPKIEFPVSTETRPLSHLVEWEHGEIWNICQFVNTDRSYCFVHKLMITIEDDEYKYLDGHYIDGLRVCPYAVALVAVWDTIAMTTGYKVREISVQFSDVKFHSQPPIYNQQVLQLTVMVARGTGRFEVIYDKQIMIEGCAVFIVGRRAAINFEETEQYDQEKLNKDDIYKLFHENGLEYRDDFQSLHTINSSLTQSQIHWRDNWVTFIDGIFQTCFMRNFNDHACCEINFIKKMVVNIKAHRRELIDIVSNDNLFTARFTDFFTRIRCGGVYIENMFFKHKPLRIRQSVTLLSQKFRTSDQNDVNEGVCANDYYVPTKYESRLINACELRCSQPGIVDSLKWIEVQEPSGPGIEVNVHYAGLSMKDAKSMMVEMPNVSAGVSFGMDFSGFTTRGDRVMGLTDGRSASTKIRAFPELLWPVPDHWSMEDAATVPFAYAHAFYCMTIKFKLKKGMTILVHGGAGAFGQAAISLALAYDCRVFTTVSDVSKKRFLKKLFPELRDDHIGNSRDSSFADMIKNKMKRNSHDEGCDLICGYTKGELKELSLSCCGVSGYTIDIAQLVEQENFSFGLGHLFFCRSYSIADFSSIFRENNLMEMRKLQLLISEGIRQGYVRPLSRVTYEPHEAPRAFRLLAGSRHYGRVLLSVLQATMVAKPRLLCTTDRNHLIICDSNGFGLHVAETLVNSGITRLYLHCQETPYVKHKVKNWERKGISVKVSSENISCQENVVGMLKTCSATGNIEGVYVLATNPEQKYEMAAVVTNLDAATRLLCPDLRHFAVISEEEKPLWKQIIVNRAKEGLPSLFLRLIQLQRHDPKFTANDKFEENLPWRCAVEAVEAALTSRDALVIAYVQPTCSQDILKEVAKIPGVNIRKDTTGRTTLEQIGLDEGRAQELRNILQQKFNINIPKNDIPRMTVAQLQNLRGEQIDIEQDVEGFAAYFSYFDSDILQATCDVVIMPTLIHRDTLRPDEFDVGRDYLCVIPGLEGHYARFDNLCNRLKIAAVVLQPDYRDCTLKDIAQRKAKTIMRKLTATKTFYLLGYDFGVLVAMEIASILESHGFTGTVFMLGGTPLDICNSFRKRWEGTTLELQQNALIKQMHKVITTKSDIEFDNELASKKSWDDKVECLVKELTYASQYTRTLVQGIYARIQILQQHYCKKYELRSKLILIRAKLSCPELDTLENFHKEIKVHDIKAVLAQAHRDLACSNIVNMHLDKDIIDAYENGNKCETVLINEACIKLQKD